MLRKKLLISAVLVTLITSCTSINADVDIMNSIKIMNILNFKKSSILKLATNLSFYDSNANFNSKNIMVEDVNYKGAKLEIFKNVNNKNDKVIYWVHGGAFLYPISNVYRSVAEYMISLNDNYDIALLDYTTLPTARYPMANDQTEFGLQYLEKHYKSINMLGDSAGGNLVVSTLIKRMDEKKKLVKTVSLYSPFLDIDFTVDSRKRNKNKDMLIGNPYYKSYEFDKLLVDNDYYMNVKDKKHPYISPIYYDNFKGFPPTYIEVGKEEVLYDDSFILANKLNNVTMNSVSGLFHDFQIMLSIKTARDSIMRTYDFIDKHNEK